MPRFSSYLQATERLKDKMTCSVQVSKFTGRSVEDTLNRAKLNHIFGCICTRCGVFHVADRTRDTRQEDSFNQRIHNASFLPDVSALFLCTKARTRNQRTPSVIEMSATLVRCPHSGNRRHVLHKTHGRSGCRSRLPAPGTLPGPGAWSSASKTIGRSINLKEKDRL